MVTISISRSPLKEPLKANFRILLVMIVYEKSGAFTEIPSSRLLILRTPTERTPAPIYRNCEFVVPFWLLIVP